MAFPDRGPIKFHSSVEEAMTSIHINGDTTLVRIRFDETFEQVGITSSNGTTRTCKYTYRSRTIVFIVFGHNQWTTVFMWGQHMSYPDVEGLEIINTSCKTTVKYREDRGGFN